MSKVALITGVTGQDGSYLSECLLEKGYFVHGVVRRTSMFNRQRIEHLRDNGRFKLHYGDLGDSSSLNQVVADTRPDEIYNLAAQSHVGVSFEQPEYTANVTGTGVLRVLAAMRSNRLDSTRFYQASTSELFGKVAEVPQTEKTPFYPRSPYGAAKLYAFGVVRNYRESYDMHASNGILFNHESPRRGESFVTRKITLSLAKMRAGAQQILRLGNLEAKRDWGYAKDYVEAMWCMLQQAEPDDYVIATGEAHTVREFVERAGHVAGFDIVWEGHGVEEVGRDRHTGELVVQVDPSFYRPAEVDLLLGDARKARQRLGWKPKVKFDRLVEIMMRADLDLVGA